MPPITGRCRSRQGNCKWLARGRPISGSGAAPSSSEPYRLSLLAWLASRGAAHALNAYQARLEAGYSAFAIFGSDLSERNPDNQPRLVCSLGGGTAR